MKLQELFEAKKEEFDATWHGGNKDMAWYDAYKSQPVKVKVKNHSGIGGQPSGTYTVKSFTKVGPTKAEFTINYQGSPSTASIDLDDPATVVTKSYDRVYPFKFYSGEMPITPRQAFNLIQVKNGKSISEGLFDRFKRKSKPESKIVDPGKYPKPANIDEWMTATVEYYKEKYPDAVWKLFCPSSADYLPVRVRVGTSEEAMRKHMSAYKLLRDANPDEKKIARSHYTDYNKYPDGPPEDYTN